METFPFMKNYEITDMCDCLNSKYSELYCPAEHMAVYKVIAKYKGNISVHQYLNKLEICNKNI
jgi:hypothetical protein